MNHKCVFAIAVSLSILTNCSKEEPQEDSPKPSIALKEAEDKQSAKKIANEKKQERQREAEAAERQAKEQARIAKERAKEDQKKLAQAKAAKAKKAAAEKRKGITRRAKAAAARKALVGKSLGEVKTKDATYTHTKVEGANEFALTIFHSSGATTIEYPDLPSKIRTRILYHAGDYQLAKENADAPDKPLKVVDKSTIAKKSPGKRSSKQSTEEEASSGPSEAQLAEAKLLIEEFKTRYSLMKGERAASQKAIGHRQREISALDSNLYKKMRKNSDVAALKKAQGSLHKLIVADAKIESEVALLLRKMAFTPYEYVMLKSEVDDYEKRNNEYYLLKGKLKLAKSKRSIKYYQVTRSSVKSAKEDRALANMEKAISKMDMEAAKKLAALTAFSNRLRDARGEVTRARKR